MARENCRQEETAVPFYLTRFSYTPETWARLAPNPEDRREAAKSYIETPFRLPSRPGRSSPAVSR